MPAHIPDERLIARGRVSDESAGSKQGRQLIAFFSHRLDSFQLIISVQLQFNYAPQIAMVYPEGTGVRVP